MKQLNLGKALCLSALVAVMGVGASMTSVSALDHHGKGHGHLTSAMNNPARLEEHVVRDGDRKPDEVLAFAGLKPGMQVLDLYASGGYYSMVMAGAVGQKGKVYAHNTMRAKERNGEKFAADFGKFKNIELLYGDANATGLADNSMDMVTFVLLYHHNMYDENNPNATPAGTVALYEEVKRVLKPGGTFLVIEHEAVAGSSRADSASWHRATAAASIEDATSVGFEFAGDAPIHVNADDPMNMHWGPAGMRGKTTRFVHKFTKPE